MDIKIGFIGAASCGKSQLIERIQEKAFSEKYTPTIGLDFVIHYLKIDGRSVKLQCWDTSGQQRFSSIITNYIRGFHIAVICYDVAIYPVEQIRTKINHINTHCSTQLHAVYVVGCKADQKQLVSQQQLQQIFSNIDSSHFFLTSSLINQGIQKFLAAVAKKVQTIKVLDQSRKDRNIRYD